MSIPPTSLADVRLITISGRIASGSTTLAKKLAQHLNWRHIEGGEIFWEAIRQKLQLDPKDTALRPDDEDQAFEQYQKKVLTEDKDIVLETKLAGFNAQGIEGVFKILVICVDESGEDQTNIRIDRLVNREGMSIEQAKEEVLIREKNDIEKWQRFMQTIMIRGSTGTSGIMIWSSIHTRTIHTRLWILH